MPLPVEVVPRCWVLLLLVPVAAFVEVVLLARRDVSVAVCVLLLLRPLLVLLPAVVVARDDVLEELLPEAVVERVEVPDEVPVDVVAFC